MCGVPGILLCNPSHISSEGPSDDETQADGSVHLCQRSYVHQSQKAAGDILQERPDATVCEMHRDGP